MTKHSLITRKSQQTANGQPGLMTPRSRHNCSTRCHTGSATADQAAGACSAKTRGRAWDGQGYGSLHWLACVCAPAEPLVLQGLVGGRPLRGKPLQTALCPAHAKSVPPLSPSEAAGCTPCGQKDSGHSCHGSSGTCILCEHAAAHAEAICLDADGL